MVALYRRSYQRSHSHKSQAISPSHVSTPRPSERCQRKELPVGEMGRGCSVLGKPLNLAPDSHQISALSQTTNNHNTHTRHNPIFGLSIRHGHLTQMPCVDGANRKICAHSNLTGRPKPELRAQNADDGGGPGVCAYAHGIIPRTHTQQGV